MTQSAFFLKTNQWTNTQNDRFLWRWLSQKLKDSICRLPLNIFDVYEPDKRQQQLTKLKKKKPKKKNQNAALPCVSAGSNSRGQKRMWQQKKWKIIWKGKIISLSWRGYMNTWAASSPTPTWPLSPPQPYLAPFLSP